MSLASDRPEFTPPSTSGRGRAIGLAVLAHVFLIAALTWGVGWKRESTNAPVQAELWSATVQQAAPALVEPTPPPQVEPKPEPKVEPPPQPPKPVKVVEPEPEPKIDPQIAIEKAKKEEKKKLEKKKADEAKEKAKALAKKEAEEEAAEEARLEALDKKKRALEAKKAKDAKEAKAAANDAKYEASLKAAREANLKRIAGIAGASGGETATGTAKQSTGPSAGYEGRIMARIKPNWVFTREINGNLVCVVEVTTSSDGRIIRTRISESSGNPAWDEASLRAMEKTEIIPKDMDGRLHSPYLIKFDSKKLL